MRKLVFLIFVLSILLLSACQGTTNVEGKVTIRIMAAASLTEVFNDLKEGFEVNVENVKLEINYAGSQALYSQINSGVSADIFASANIKYMKQLRDIDMVLDPTIFAHNKLVIVVSNETEKSIQDIRDLLKGGVKLVIADESVPVGRYTVQILKKHATKPGLPTNFKDKFFTNVLSKELDVKSVVAKVELGEADAGIVYKTDVNVSNRDKVRIVDIEDRYNVTTNYPISILRGISSQKEEAANRFLEYLYSQEGGKILEEHGFIVESRG